MFFLIGAALGAITGVPIGPVNVAVIDAAYRHSLRRAFSVGLGGALADCLYSALGVLGVTPVVRTYKSVPPLLYLASGIVLLGYGFLTARSQPVAPAPPTADEARESSTTIRRREMWSGFTVGLGLIVLNPAAIVTWVVIIGQFIPVASTSEGIACALGVACGSFGWFSFVAYLTHKGKSVLGDKAAWIPRLVGIALMVYSVYLLTQAVRLFAAA
jgi:threonine/homoserine/homoserine lactone efflux protein